MAIVAAVLLVTNVVLITPDITVASVSIVDPNYLKDVERVTLRFDNPGMQHQLSAMVLPKKANNKKVHWSIENSVSFDPDFEGDIATVDENGKVTINWTGTFDVVAKTDDGGKTDRCHFEVKSDVANSAYIVKNGKKLEKDERISLSTDEILRLEACARPIDVDLEYVTWESSNTNVLTVDANGVVVPKRVGNATVTMKLKSNDYIKGKETKTAPVLTQFVEIEVRKGTFSSAVKYVNERNVSLSSIGAEGSTLSDKSVDAKLEGDEVVFEKSTGVAVLEKDGRTMTLIKVESEKSLVFENSAQIENDTIIVGKVPYKLNAIFATSGAKASDARYSSSNPEVATIDENTGLITAISSGEVTFTAEYDGKETSITLKIKKPVIYFSLEKDAPQGIANECIYGSLSFEYADEKIVGLTPTRQIKITEPVELSGNDKLNHFEWSITSDDNIASIDKTGKITFKEFERGVQKTVTVTARAIDSPYSCDRITREYKFTVMYGVNVTNSDEITKAVNEEIDGTKHDVFVRNDITVRSIRYTEQDTSKLNVSSSDKGEEVRRWFEAPLTLETSLYGNGHTIDWKHKDFDNATDKANIMGSNIFMLKGQEDKNAPRVLLRNVKVKSSELPKESSFASNDFVGIGVQTMGNVHVQYCIIENSMYCMRIGGYDNQEKAVEKGDFNETLIEGTVMYNSSKFTCFTWETFVNQRIAMKNCVFGQSAAPSIGFSSGRNEEEFSCNFDIQGMLRVYNWKQNVELDLIGGITSDPQLDGMLKKIINQGLASKRYEHLFVKDNGIPYFNCGMMFSGLNFSNKTTVTGDLEKNGFSKEVIKLGDLAKEIGGKFLESIANGFHPITIYGYIDESKTPVKHTSSLVLSREMYELLRGEK